MKTIRMLTDGVGGNGELLEKGRGYTLEDASADHWLKRGKAELANDEGDEDDAGIGGGTGKPSDGLKVEELKAALAEAGVEIPEGVTKKADLAALLDAAFE